jgi:hypothetical protein
VNDLQGGRLAVQGKTDVPASTGAEQYSSTKSGYRTGVKQAGGRSHRIDSLLLRPGGADQFDNEDGPGLVTRPVANNIARSQGLW